MPQLVGTGQFGREKEGPWMKGQRMIKKEWYLLVLSLNLTSLSLDYCVLTSFLSLLPTLAFNLKCLFNFPILLSPPQHSPAQNVPRLCVIITAKSKCASWSLKSCDNIAPIHFSSVIS